MTPISMNPEERIYIAGYTKQQRRIGLRNLNIGEQLCVFFDKKH
jgi:hypothetical protein